MIAHGAALNTSAIPITQHNEREPVVRVSNVSKKFCKRLKRSMSYGIADLARNLVGMRPDSTRLRREEFWALRNVCFELKRGDVLGLIGVNGSGKTTLLRLLAGILPPDTGEIVMMGRVGALIALGAGFHPYFTGRENVYLNGAILGIDRDELDEHFDEIVEFAEIGDFIDAPVATYSSGMRVRLGFAVAITMKPDVLLIDEVLAVGDLSFKIKCLNAINKLLRNAAVVFVSHSMQLVSRICNQIMVLHLGEINHCGNDVGAGIDYYTSQFPTSEKRISGSGRATISEVRIRNAHAAVHGDEPLVLHYGEDLSLEIVLSLDPSIRRPAVKVLVVNQEMYPVAECFSEHCGFHVQPQQGETFIKVTWRGIPLNNGIYSLGIVVLDVDAHNEILVRSDNAAFFRVAYSTRSWSSVILKGEWEQCEA